VVRAPRSKEARLAERPGWAGPPPGRGQALARGAAGGGAPQRGGHRRARAAARLAAPAGSAGLRAHFALAEALRKERRHLKAIALYSPVVSRCADRALRARALFSLATSRSIATPQAAPAVFDRLLEEFPEHRADEARFATAMLDLRAGRVASARARFEGLSSALPRARRTPEALFHLYWIERGAGPRGAALAAVDRLAAACQGPGCDFDGSAPNTGARGPRRRRDGPEELRRMERLALDHRGPSTRLALRRLELKAPSGRRYAKRAQGRRQPGGGAEATVRAALAGRP
jgi:tetratricopeptide (TPR) repeat protein